MPKKEIGEFGKRFAALLDEKQVSIRTASEVSGIPPSTLQDWRSGVLPSGSFEGLARLCLHLGVTFEYLMTGSNMTLPGPLEAFVTGGSIFRGYLKVNIERVIPRNEVDEERS